MSDLIILKGSNHYKALHRLHSALQPRRYFEIGTQTGGTLSLANCRSVAVDPNFKLNTDVLNSKPSLMLFRQTSDAFFAQSDLHMLLGGTVDLAFLDGLHLFEFLLRDFINTERFCSPNSIIVLHDCIPPDNHVARRQEADRHLSDESEHPNWWAGDVWKVLPILKKYRTDLDITIFDAAPTGLVFITNLDPNSNVLTKLYFQICREWSGDQEVETLEQFLKSISLTSTESLASVATIGRYWF